jgi:hypothetical protein
MAFGEYPRRMVFGREGFWRGEGVTHKVAEMGSSAGAMSCDWMTVSTTVLYLKAGKG